MLSSTTKHFLHCFVFGFFAAISQLYRTIARSENKVSSTDHGYLTSILFNILELLILMALPYALESAVGLFMFNAFKDEVTLDRSDHQYPLICFRIVTRGDFPELVMENVERNRALCDKAGLKDFLLEVVTDKPIGVTQTSYTKEVIVPTTYRTSSGAKYKARALQYCLEKGVNSLDDECWIVHLDEETILTKNSIHGILNFISRGKHHIGQGLITYANEGIVNWFTTMCDCVRVSDDMGRLRLELKVFHQPIFAWKGSFIVVQAGVEKKITFDHGLKGSLLEDNFFSTHATMQGYSFDFIEGEMWEKSPFTVRDLIQQRKRWVQGYHSLAHDSTIPIRYRIFSLIGFYTMICLPVSTWIMVLERVYHFESIWLIEDITTFMFVIGCYLHIYGVLKSFRNIQVGLFMYMLILVTGLLSLLFNVVVSFWAAILAIVCEKPSFYIVRKGNKNAPVAPFHNAASPVEMYTKITI